MATRSQWVFYSGGGAFCIFTIVTLGLWPSKLPDESAFVWSDASQAVILGDVSVKVTGANVAQTTGYVSGLKTDARRTYPDANLHIFMLLTNTGQEAVDYAGLGHRYDFALSDNLGKRHSRVDFPHGLEIINALPGEPARIGGWHPRGATLQPGKVVRDQLVATQPNGGIEYLNLTLPGGAFGAKVDGHIRIPRAMIFGLG